MQLTRVQLNMNPWNTIIIIIVDILKRYSVDRAYCRHGTSRGTEQTQ